MIRNFLKSSFRKTHIQKKFSNSTTGMDVLIEERFSKMLNNYNKKPENEEDYKKQLQWRARNLGMKEMDILIGTWTRENLKNCSLEEALQFERDILTIETPDLFKLIFMTQDEISKLDIPNNHYLFVIRNYAAGDWNKV